MRRLLVVAILPAIVVFGAVASAVASAGSGPDDSPSAALSGTDTEADADAGSDADATDEGVHGGPIDRLHAHGACDRTDVASLDGNWTHGDYVSAVAALGDDTLVPTAAQSDCGKPAHTGHPEGAGRPEGAGQPDGVGKPDHAGPPDDADETDDAAD